MSSTTTPRAAAPTAPIAKPGSRSRLPIGRWILVVSVLFAIYAWTFGPYGVVRQYHTAERLKAMEVRNDSLRRRVRDLQDSLKLLSDDSATIAGEARRLGLILPGEVAVRFVDTGEGAPRR